MIFKEKEVLLPQTPEALERFIADLKRDYALPDDLETDYSVANMVMHLPATQAYAKPSYFANGVLRGMAQKAAYRKTEETRKVLIERDEAEKRAKEEAEKKPELKVVGNETAVEPEPIQHA